MKPSFLHIQRFYSRTCNNFPDQIHHHYFAFQLHQQVCKYEEIQIIFNRNNLELLTLEIPENGTLFRVPMSTVEYQIGHDQKLFFLPLEPQQV